MTAKLNFNFFEYMDKEKSNSSGQSASSTYNLASAPAIHSPEGDIAKRPLMSGKPYAIHSPKEQGERLPSGGYKMQPESYGSAPEDTLKILSDDEIEQIAPISKYHARKIEQAVLAKERARVEKMTDKDIERFSIPKGNPVGTAMVYYLQSLKKELRGGA